jgi:hypothetical protein
MFEKWKSWWWLNESGIGEPWVGADWRPVIVMHRRPLEQ